MCGSAMSTNDARIKQPQQKQEKNEGKKDKQFELTHRTYIS